MKNQILFLFVLFLFSFTGNAQSTNQSNTVESGSDIENLFKEDLDCLGTEPYWDMQIKKDLVILSNPNDTKRLYNIIKFKQSLNNTNQWYIAAESLTGQRISIYLIEQICSDDMSDYEYKYRVLIYDGKKDDVINGCCNRIEK